MFLPTLYICKTASLVVNAMLTIDAKERNVLTTLSFWHCFSKAVLAKALLFNKAFGDDTWIMW